MIERRINHLASTRAAVWDASGGVCHYCGDALHPFRNFQLDHKVALTAGGADSLGNLVAACRDCNIRKGNRNGFDPTSPRTERKQAGQSRRHYHRFRIDGSKLRAIRLRQKLTLRDLRERSGVAADTILDIEHGRRNPNQQTVRKLADALGIAPAELLPDAACDHSGR